MENTSDALRSRKVLSKDPCFPEFLRNAENSNETFELLMTTHFPSCKDEVGEECEPQDNLKPTINKSQCFL